VAEKGEHRLKEKKIEKFTFCHTHTQANKAKFALQSHQGHGRYDSCDE